MLKTCVLLKMSEEVCYATKAYGEELPDTIDKEIQNSYFEVINVLNHPITSVCRLYFFKSMQLASCLYTS